jgi:hypothetical protein
MYIYMYVQVQKNSAARRARHARGKQHRNAQQPLASHDTMSTPPTSPARKKAPTPARGGGALKRQNTTAGQGWVWNEEWTSLKTGEGAMIKMIVDVPEADDQMAVKGMAVMTEKYAEAGENVPGVEILYGFNDKMIDEAAQKVELEKTLSDVKFPIKTMGSSEMMASDETPNKATYMVICSPLGGRKEDTLAHLSDMDTVMAKAGVDADTIVIFTSCDKYNYTESSEEGQKWLDARIAEFADTTLDMKSGECMLRPSPECIARSGMAGSEGMKAWMEFTLKAALCPVDPRKMGFWINLIYNGKGAGSNAKAVSEMVSVLQAKEFAPYLPANEIALRYMARDWKTGMRLLERMEDSASEDTYLYGLGIEEIDDLESDANWAMSRGLCQSYMPWMKEYGKEPSDEEYMKVAMMLKERLKAVMGELEGEWSTEVASKRLLCEEAMKLSLVLYHMRAEVTMADGKTVTKDFCEITDAEHAAATDYTFITRSIPVNFEMVKAAFYGLWDKVTQWVAERAAILVLGTEREPEDWIATWKEDMDSYPQNKDNIKDEEVEACPGHIAGGVEEGFMSGRFNGMTPIYDMAALIPLFGMATGKMSPKEAKDGAKNGSYAGEKGMRLIEEMMLSLTVSGGR